VNGFLFLLFVYGLYKALKRGVMVYLEHRRR
jgi:hypothetical protein